MGEVKQNTESILVRQERTLKALLGGFRSLRHAIFDSSEATFPTSFVILPYKLSPSVPVSSDNVAAATAEDGTTEACSQVEERIKKAEGWVKTLHGLASDLSGTVTAAANSALERAVTSVAVENKLYLYLLDEVSREPVLDGGKGAVYPIEITTPSKNMQLLAPLLMVTLSGFSLINTVAGAARLLGYPVPSLPVGFIGAARTSLEAMSSPSTAAAFPHIHAQVKNAVHGGGGGSGSSDGAAPRASLRAMGGSKQEKCRGAALEELKKFLQENDPDGRYKSLLQRYGDKSGTTYWTTEAGIKVLRQQEADAEIELLGPDTMEGVVVSSRNNRKDSMRSLHIPGVNQGREVTEVAGVDTSASPTVTVAAVPRQSPTRPTATMAHDTGMDTGTVTADTAGVSSRVRPTSPQDGGPLSPSFGSRLPSPLAMSFTPSPAEAATLASSALSLTAAAAAAGGAGAAVTTATNVPDPSSGGWMSLGHSIVSRSFSLFGGGSGRAAAMALRYSEACLVTEREMHSTHHQLLAKQLTWEREKLTSQSEQEREREREQHNTLLEREREQHSMLLERERQERERERQERERERQERERVHNTLLERERQERERERQERERERQERERAHSMLLERERQERERERQERERAHSMQLALATESFARERELLTAQLERERQERM